MLFFFFLFFSRNWTKFLHLKKNRSTALCKGLDNCQMHCASISNRWTFIPCLRQCAPDNEKKEMINLVMRLFLQLAWLNFFTLKDFKSNLKYITVVCSINFSWWKVIELVHFKFSSHLNITKELFFSQKAILDFWVRIKIEQQKFCLIQRVSFLSIMESWIGLSNTESKFYLSNTDSNLYVLVWNRLWCCNFFSMLSFKYFFRQFSYKIFQVSLRLVEGLWSKLWKKVTRNWHSGIII